MLLLLHRLLSPLSLSARIVLPLLLVLGLLSLPGCRGCRVEPEDDPAAQQAEDEAREEDKKPPPDFEIEQLTLQPADRAANLWIKPGHWVSVSQEMTANNFDFLGQLEVSVVDQQGVPLQLSHTPFRLTTTRPAVLPKGQVKQLELPLFVPHESRSVQLRSALQGRFGRGDLLSSQELFGAMPAYQYFMVVLSDLPDRYAFIQQLDSVRVPAASQYSTAPEFHYRVVAPAPTKPLPLPSRSLAWTSTAYVVWDGIDPELLSSEQQQALVDWIHWGGNLIISGPRSFDLLRGSFLADYLPATAAQATQFDAQAFAELNRYWGQSERRQPHRPLTARPEWSGMQLTPHTAARPVPHAGELFWERGIGRGRIVLSAVHLNERELINWPGFDGLFNAGLLGRPARRYGLSPFDELVLTWADATHDRHDAKLVSPLRIFSRDAGIATPETSSSAAVAVDPAPQLDEFRQLPTSAEIPSDVAGGVASWNSFSPVSRAAADSLRRAAGIKIPQANFVLWVLAIYLVVLVPVNWAFFTLIGRTEWAWAAAPVISIIFAVLVIRLAQLDIGFARSQTELAVLEVQGSYPRAHLTRYTALYTSLSTTYELHFDDSEAIAQPLPGKNAFRLIPGQSLDTVTYRRGEDVSLAGLTVSSNSTGMVHSEEFFELQGTIELQGTASGGYRVTNGSRLALEQVAVLRRGTGAEAGTLEGCWIGTLPTGQAAPLEWESLDTTRPFARQRELPAEQGTEPLDLQELMALAESLSNLEPGEVRLVGSTSQVLPGERTEPAATQVRGETLVVVHLQYELPRVRQLDVNTRAEMVQARDERQPPEATIP